MIDIAVIGCGPAGLSAAINGVQRNKTVTVFGKKIETSFIYKAENVDNYLGMQNVTGKEMMETFFRHAKEKGVTFSEGRVLQVFPMGDYYNLNVDNTFVEAKTVILASGLALKKAAPGEERLLGSGVSYCATCDGMLYRNKVVAVIGEEEEAENDALFLSEICEKVYYLPLYKDFKPFSDKVTLLSGRMQEVLGEETVSGIVVSGETIPVEGAFFIKATTPISSLVYGLQMEGQSISVNRQMETNLKRLFAAGDCTGKPFQVAKAVGEGLIAALSAARVIDEESKQVQKK